MFLKFIYPINISIIALYFTYYPLCCFVYFLFFLFYQIHTFLKFNFVKFLFTTVNNDLTASDDLKFKFATDGEGNHGYLGADDSFIPFSFVKHLGHFTGNTSINVSALGATSAAQFLIVCGSSKSISGSGSRWYARDNVDLHYPYVNGSYSPATKTLSNGTLNITAPSCSASAYNLIGDNPSYVRGSCSASGNIPYDVYFISNA